MTHPTEKRCPPHSFGTHGADDGVERCRICGISWRDWARGFGSNVEPGERTKLLRAEREAELA